MTADVTDRPVPARPNPGPSAPVRSPAPGRRLLGLVRAELTMLLRNRMQLGTAILMPVAVPFLYLPIARAGAGPAHLAGALGMMFVIALLFVVYYNLLCAYVARRQELVLKRLRTGEASDATVLAAAAVPAMLVAAVMIAVMSAISVPLLDLPVPRQVLLILLGVVLGGVLMVPLALVTANITRTVESAQVTCLPIMAVLVLGTGAAVPLDLMPDWLGRLITVIPSSPIVALIRMGWLGIDADGAPLSTGALWADAGVQTVILLVWLVLACVLVAQRFRWEPRG
ncbi:ABC transporter permease [Brachybacterium sp. AOP25-B2-12]|uniref:ABC transporter permease n=1 Tax=Brachybacterium sp. AOP25-B2-12 TaxID=3457710 RepID=UPI0040346679